MGRNFSRIAYVGVAIAAGAAACAAYMTFDDVRTEVADNISGGGGLLVRYAPAEQELHLRLIHGER